MTTHVKVLGILYIVLSSLTLCAALFLALAVGTASGIVAANAGSRGAAVTLPIIGTAGPALVMFLVAIALPGIITGVGLLKYKPWARIVGIVLAVISGGLFGNAAASLLGGTLFLGNPHGNAGERLASRRLALPIEAPRAPLTAAVVRPIAKELEPQVLPEAESSSEPPVIRQRMPDVIRPAEELRMPVSAAATANAGAEPAPTGTAGTPSPSLVNEIAAGPVTLLPESVAKPTPPTSAPAVTASPAVDPPAAQPPQEPLVRSVLNAYASAYSQLDADAAARVWPGVNRAGLSRAFAGLASQKVSLGNCNVVVNGATAHAQCAGSMTWSPRIGAGEKTEARQWTFDLARSSGDWRIVGARVQNR